MPAPANPGKTLLGQVYNRALDLFTKFTAVETSSDQGTDLTGTNGQDVTPKNTAVSEVTTFNRTAYQAALAGFMRSSPATADVSVPPVLQSFYVNILQANQTATGSTAGTADSSGDANWELQVHDENENSTGSNIDFIIYPVIKYPDGSNKPVTDYEFYVPGPTITRAAVIAALNSKFTKTVSDWPCFLPREEHVVMVNASGNIRANASVTISASAFANDTSAGDSFADTIGTRQAINIQLGGREITVPPTLHAKIGIVDTDNSEITASAEVSITYNGTPYTATATPDPVLLVGTANATCPPTFDGSAALSSGLLVVGQFYYITNFVSGDNFTNVGGSNVTDYYFQATGTTPTNWTHGSTLQACLPDWPSTGEYLMGLDTENFEVGYFRVRARTFNFAIQLGA